MKVSFNLKSNIISGGGGGCGAGLAVYMLELQDETGLAAPEMLRW